MQILLLAIASNPKKGSAYTNYKIFSQGQEETLTLGSFEALGMSREGPMRLPRALVPIHTVSRLVGSDDGILTKPYDLTFMQVTCRQADKVSLSESLYLGFKPTTAHYGELDPDEDISRGS